MTTFFRPIPPDTASSLRHDLLEKARGMGLGEYFSPSGGEYGSMPEATLPDTDDAKEFIKWAKTFCSVIHSKT